MQRLAANWLEKPVGNDSNQDREGGLYSGLGWNLEGEGVGGVLVFLDALNPA